MSRTTLFSVRRRLAATAGLAMVLLAVSAAPAGACAGLVTPGGNVRLLRTATLAAYVDGVEHYVTSFQFSGGGAEFGSIVPLPAIPSKVERGGDWTLQRLERETKPQALAASGASRSSAESDAEVIYETRIDALDITILKGGGKSVGDWARQHGFALTPDAPEVLDYYAARSKIFMAARFNAEAARERGQQVGDGTPIHLTIPTARPWVPVRILSLGLAPDAQVDADVYLLTERKPSMLPRPEPVGSFEGEHSLRRDFDGAARPELLADLRSDKGMEWVPASMWLTSIRINGPASSLRHDLSIDPTGRGRVSYRAAGLASPARPTATTTTTAAPPTTVPPTTLPPTTVPATTPTSEVAAPPVDATGWTPASAATGLGAFGLLTAVATGAALLRRRRGLVG